jgi:hypothetical protein
MTTTNTVRAKRIANKPPKTESPEYTQASRRGRDDRTPLIARTINSPEAKVAAEAAHTGTSASHQLLEPPAITADSASKSMANNQPVNPPISRTSTPKTPGGLIQERRCPEG